MVHRSALPPPPCLCGTDGEIPKWISGIPMLVGTQHSSRLDSPAQGHKSEPEKLPPADREIQSTSGGQSKSTYFKEALLDNEFTPSVNALKQLDTGHGEKETLEVVWTT